MTRFVLYITDNDISPIVSPGSSIRKLVKEACQYLNSLPNSWSAEDIVGNETRISILDLDKKEVIASLMWFSGDILILAGDDDPELFANIPQILDKAIVDGPVLWQFGVFDGIDKDIPEEPEEYGALVAIGNRVFRQISGIVEESTWCDIEDDETEYSWNDLLSLGKPKVIFPIEHP